MSSSSSLLISSYPLGFFFGLKLARLDQLEFPLMLTAFEMMRSPYLEKIGLFLFIMKDFSESMFLKYMTPRVLSSSYWYTMFSSIWSRPSGTY
jgi:hypothetical protein